MRPVLKVHVDATGQGTIELDGHDISRAVSSVEFVTAAGDVTRATLHLIGVQLDIESEVEVDEITRLEAKP